MEITENDIMKTSIIFILISPCTHIVLLIEIFNTCKKKITFQIHLNKLSLFLFLFVQPYRTKRSKTVLCHNSKWPPWYIVTWHFGEIKRRNKRILINLIFPNLQFTYKRHCVIISIVFKYHSHYFVHHSCYFAHFQRNIPEI